MSKDDSLHQASENDIAIIGMSCRFPGADSLDAFWQNLRDGVESVTFFSKEAATGCDPAVRDQPDYVPAAGMLCDADQFDASFFGYSDKDAALMDPQQRVLLECAWEAMEDAGYAAKSAPGPTGVFAGTGVNSYLINNVHPACGFAPQRTFLESTCDLQVLLANGSGFAPTRISYKLDLRGPSINIQSACSTSLVAVHVACQSLLAGECALALAGAAAIRAPAQRGHLFQEGMIFSPDGHCRSFDANARGTVFGDGVGMVALKLLGSALNDGDSVHAVIKGSAINNDGAMKVGYSAPSVQGQADVIAQALSMADVDPATVTYVEAHGSGTELGDPIEIAALTRAFRAASRDRSGAELDRCAIGSVKTNIGHLAEASGIAGLIKTVLALKHRRLPPSLHFQRANPQIGEDSARFFINTTLAKWPVTGAPRRAGVSAFGMGGANAHLILQEAPPTAANRNPMERDSHLFTLSAASSVALRQLARRFQLRLNQRPDAELADICFTANAGREHFGRRLAIVANTTSQLRARLDSHWHDQDEDKHAETFPYGADDRPQAHSSEPRVGFALLDSQSQLGCVGRRLAKTQPTFRKLLETCDQTLQDKGYARSSLFDLLWDERINCDVDGDPVSRETAQFSLQYAIAKLWESWGIRPAAVYGRGRGEIVAACLTDTISLNDGLRLAAERGRSLRKAAPHHRYRDLQQECFEMPTRSDEADVWLKIGPQHVALVSEPHIQDAGSVASDWDDWRELLKILARLYLAGASVDWSGFDRDYSRRRLHLPTYPFQRTRHWIDAPQDRIEQNHFPSDPRTAHRQPDRRPSGSSLDEIASAGEVCGDLQPRLRELMSQDRVRRYQASLERLDAISERFIVHALASMGWQFRFGQRFSTAEMARDLRVSNSRWLHRLLRILEQSGSLRAANINHSSTLETKWELCSPTQMVDPSAELDALSCPESTAEQELLRRCGPRLADALRGACNPTEVLFPDGDASVVASFYQQSPMLQIMNALLQDALSRIIDPLTDRGRLRILEIGAGAGATTSHILPRLPSKGVEYVFTDVGVAFLARARRRFRDFPFVEYRKLDIERSGAEQGLEDQFDLIVAANALHVARDLAPAMRNVRQLLAPNGLLLAIEGTAQSSWVDLTFGFAPGWWRFEDHHVRPEHALVSADEWKRQLALAGFGDVASLSTQNGSRARQGLPHALLIARAEAAATSTIEFRPQSSKGSTDRLAQAPPSDRLKHIQRCLCEQIERTLGIHLQTEEPSLDRDLYDLGMDSLSAIELRAQLQNELRITLPSTLLHSHPTVRQLAEYLEQAIPLGSPENLQPQESGEAPGSWRPQSASRVKGGGSTIIPLQTQGSAQPFFIVPGVMGDVSQFQQLSRCFGRRQPLFGLHPSGLDEGTAPWVDLAGIASHYVAAIRSAPSSGPFLLGGHSFGGLVAFEMAQQLLDEGQDVALLAIMDVQATVGEKYTEMVRRGDLCLSAMKAVFQRTVAADLTIASEVESTPNPTASEQLTELACQLSAAGLPYTAAELQRMLRVLQANIEAMAEYRPRLRHRLPIALLRASEVHSDDRFLPAAAATREDPTWGWSQYSSAPINPHIVPGNHFSMLTQPHVRVVAQQLMACLNVTRLSTQGAAHGHYDC